MEATGRWTDRKVTASDFYMTGYPINWDAIWPLRKPHTKRQWDQHLQ